MLMAFLVTVTDSGIKAVDGVVAQASDAVENGTTCRGRKRDALSESVMRIIRTPRSMSGGVETELRSSR